MSSGYNVGQVWLDRFKLVSSYLAVFLAFALSPTLATAQAQDSGPASPTQKPEQTQPAQSLPKETAPATIAPSQTAPARTAPARRVRRRPTLDDRVKALAVSLDLSQTQQVAVKRILEQRQQETLRLRNDPSISGSDRIDRFRALQDQTVQRIRSVLNDEQKKKYDPLAVREVTPPPGQKSVEDWLKITTPH